MNNLKTKNQFYVMDYIKISIVIIIMSNGTITTGKLVLTDTQANADAYDRLRVSEPTTLYEIHHVFGKRQRWVDEITTGSGTSTHNQGSYVQMALSSSSVGSVIRQTYEYIPYQPGKSRLMLFTGVLETSGGVSGVTSRIGCYDDGGNKTAVSGPGNGLYFELTSSGIYVCERLNNSNTTVIQSNWNTDVFDGSGSSSNPSGLTINDFSKAMIFGIDQEWLGIGRTRYGFIINGTFYVGHAFNHSGIGTPTSTALTAPYTRSGKMPIRYEIISSTAASAEMRMICSTVISEGGFDPIGEPYSNTSVAATTAGSSVYTPIMSLRLIESRVTNRHTLLVKHLEVLNTAGGTSSANWRLYLLDDDTKLTGESFSNVHVDSAAQVDESATAVDVSGGYLIASGFVENRATHELNFEGYVNSPVINCSISGKSRILCLTGTIASGAPTLYASLDWHEIH